MKCEEAYPLLLEADPDELRGESDSLLSEHLRSCARCRMVAERISREEERLRFALDAVRPRASTEEAGKRAAREAHLRGRREIWHGLAPIAAAAGLAGILFVSTAGPTSEPLGEHTTTAAQTLPPVVEAAPGQQVAVFDTDNPNIVVVWSF
jgi:predicted anti-sigma-YlaC factor YlaD